MNWYINDKFQLAVRTWVFLLADLWVIEYDSQLSAGEINTLYEGLKNVETDLDVLESTTNSYILSEAIDSISEDLSYESYDLCFKEYGTYNIETTNLYNFSADSSTDTLICVWIKKFDKNNYIMPLMISMDKTQLDDSGRLIELEKLMRSEEKLKNLNNLIINYNNFILY